MATLDLRIRYYPTVRQWHVEQNVDRIEPQHTSSSSPTPPTITNSWKMRAQFTKLVDAVDELLQTRVEEGVNCSSIDYGPVGVNTPLMAAIRTRLASVTL